MSTDFDRRLNALLEIAESQSASIDKVNEKLDAIATRLDPITAAIAMDAENIRSLANIAASHERRISHLEGDQLG